MTNNYASAIFDHLVHSMRLLTFVCVLEKDSLSKQQIISIRPFYNSSISKHKEEDSYFMGVG